LIDLAEFYTEDMPREMENRRVAVIIKKEFLEVGRFWQFQVKKRGYHFQVVLAMDVFLDGVRPR
jgi:hypothetical protein